MKGKSGEVEQRTMRRTVLVHPYQKKVSSYAPPGFVSQSQQQNLHKVSGSGDGGFTSQIIKQGSETALHMGTCGTAQLG